MSILLVVQAGHDETTGNESQLLQFGNSTVFGTILDRVAGFEDGPVVVAISDLPADDQLEEIANEREIPVVRAPSDDLLARFVEVIADYPAEHLVRVTTSSPLIDRHLISSIVDAHTTSGADYTSNTLLRTHPAGLDVEVIRSDALLDAAEQAESADERAGVTTFVQRRPADYKLQAVLAPGDYEDHAWSGDEESLERITQLIQKSGGSFDRAWDNLLAYDRPQIPDSAVRLRVARNNVLEHLDELTDTIGFPPDPFPIGDPTRRSWGVWAGDELIGAIVVSVQNGWGTLAGKFRPGIDGDLAPQALAAVDERLLADEQVIALTIDGSAIRNYRS
ncbi:MAG: hypothetical protein HKN94_14235 [Acidimicrobiales bacterium]|nr:hypothetical protein [Acidimicrobiales bacterium]